MQCQTYSRGFGFPGEMREASIHESIRSTTTPNWLLTNTCNHLADIDRGTFGSTLWHDQWTVSPMQFFHAYLWEGNQVVASKCFHKPTLTYHGSDHWAHTQKSKELRNLTSPASSRSLFNLSVTSASSVWVASQPGLSASLPSLYSCISLLQCW